jgi:hypothetical protein
MNGDAISRQAVDKLSKELVHTTRDKADFLCNFWEGLQKLPPVTPQPKTGRWILKNGVYYCSKCNNMALNYDDCSEGKLRTDFCPNCGAFMGV